MGEDRRRRGEAGKRKKREVGRRKWRWMRIDRGVERERGRRGRERE